MNSTSLPPARLDALLDAAREAGAADALLARSAGATAVNDAVVVLRVLAARVRQAVPGRELLRADSQRGSGSPA